MADNTELIILNCVKTHLAVAYGSSTLILIMEARDVEKRYLYLNKKCGSMTGVWPYGNRWNMWIRRITMIVLSLTSLVTQIASVKMNLSTNAIIEQCPFFVTAMGIIIKEANYIINEQQLKEVLECVFDDWAMKRPKNEVDILHKYAKRGLFFNRLYLANGIFCFVIFSTVALSPRVLDLVSPKNESRGVGFVYPAYYGFDVEEHYYIVMSHMLCVATAVFIVFQACDTIYMNIVQHACALLAITAYRFKWAIGETDENIGEHSAMALEETYTRMTNSIKAHQHAIDYIIRIDSLHATYLFIAVGLIILNFSVTLVKTSMMDPCVDFYKFCGFLVVQLIHLLFLSIQGHFVILSHDSIYENMYETLWYNASRRTQALFMLALRKNLTPEYLTAGGLIFLNLETFAEILKASVSWFTVMKST